jgi:hypothetical protein
MIAGFTPTCDELGQASLSLLEKRCGGIGGGDAIFAIRIFLRTLVLYVDD